MFDSLSDKLGGIFEGLKRRGALKEADVKAAMREVRVALLEADVALPVVKSFIDDQQTESVAGFKKFFCRGIMGTSDRIESIGL